MAYQDMQGREASDARDVLQTPFGFRIGQMDDPEMGPPQSLSWAAVFNQKYSQLRMDLVTYSTTLVDGTETGSGAFRSVQNALANCDAVAAAITAGDSSRAAQLLNIMGKMIRMLKPEAQPGFLARLEELLRGIPKNLQDAVAFVAEQANQAAQTAVSGTAGKVVIGLGLAGLFGLYLWKK